MKIDKNVPPPEPKRSRYPFSDMEIGDSLFIPGEDSQGRAAVAARSHGQYTGKKFTCRREGDGCRIWRVDPDLFS